VSLTPVQAAVAEYLANGWKLTGIDPGGKAPRKSGWNKPGHEWRVPEAFKLGWGVGLLHSYSGTCAIDVDHYGHAKDWLADQGIDLDELFNADDAVRIVSGRPNRAKLLYALPVPRIHATCCPYDTGELNDKGKPIIKKALEWRCASARGTSQQDVLPPSMHPDVGKPYAWEFGMVGDWRALPPLPDALEALWERLSGAVPEAQPETTAPNSPPPEADDPKIAAWLEDQSDYGYEGWLDVGMRLHAAYQGEPAGMRLWDRWSSKDPAGYHKPDAQGRSGAAAVQAKWHSFKLTGAVKGLEGQIRQMPAAPEEFAEAKAEEPPKAVPAAAAAVAQEALGRSDIENRELLSFAVHLTGETKQPYFVMPGHPEPKIALAAGRSGVQQSAQQLDRLFGPYMQMVPIGKQSLPGYVRACDYLERARWRQEAHSVGFHPAGEPFYTDFGKRFANNYRAPKLRPIEPTRDQIEPLLWLLRRIKCEEDGEPVVARWICALYAYCLSHPGIKVRWAPLLMSRATGTGKSTITRRIPEILFGKEYVSEMTNKVLASEFTGSVYHNAWWVTVEELAMSGGRRDAKETFNEMKTVITEDSISCRRMYMDAYKMTNFIQITASSNYPDALFLEDAETDRRWLVGEMIDDPLSNDDMRRLDTLFGVAGRRHPNADAWLRWWFLDYAERCLGDFHPDMRPPITDAKREMTEAGRSGWADQIISKRRAVQYPFTCDIVTPGDIKDALLPDRITTGQAVELLRKFCGKPWRGHGRASFSRNVYVWRNPEQWAKLGEDEMREYMRTGVRPHDPVFWGERCAPEDPLLQ
jgi:hypothetical protein